jgi:hypothetical protein
MDGANNKKMKSQITQITVIAFLCLLGAPIGVWAQEDAGNDNPSITSSTAVTGSAPLGYMSQFASAGVGLEFSTGYNFTRRHALMGEFMWNWLYGTNSALQPVRDTFQSIKVGGHGNLITFTAEYKYELRGKLYGMYLIGGGGLYHRSTEITKQIPPGTSIPCQPVWVWWGYTCGTTTSSTVASSSSQTFGLNGGIGFTIRVGKAPYRWYVESRYHYAPTRNIGTQLMTFSAGFRY